MYLLDSDFLINFLNGKPEAAATFTKIKDFGLATSVICVAEILEGIYFFDNMDKLDSFSKLLKKITVINVDLLCASRFAALNSALRKAGNTLDKFDTLIAATCLASNLILVTGNKKHFERIKKLKIYDDS